MGKSLTTLALLGLFLALPNSAPAWHKHGHMAVARIAWLQLGDKEKTQLTKILKAHPHYDVFLNADRPKEVKEIDWVFARAATWSDWVRNPQGTDLTPE